MTSTYRRTFTVAVPTARAWQAFTEPAELTAWFAPSVARFEAEPGGSLEFSVGDQRAEGRVEEIEPERRIRWSQGPACCPARPRSPSSSRPSSTAPGSRSRTRGSARAATGSTSSRPTRSGGTGASPISSSTSSDGIRRPRAHARRSRFGLITIDTPAGVEVVEVVPGSFGDQAGLAAGDLVVELDRAGVYDRSDLWLLAGEHAPGDELEVVYARGRELLHGRGTLAPMVAEVLV